ncbi:hypothetical protein D3C86_1674430 [compost metagenome]
MGGQRAQRDRLVEVGTQVADGATHVGRQRGPEAARQQAAVVAELVHQQRAEHQPLDGGVGDRLGGQCGALRAGVELRTQPRHHRLPARRIRRVEIEDQRRRRVEAEAFQKRRLQRLPADDHAEALAVGIGL